MAGTGRGVKGLVPMHPLGALIQGDLLFLEALRGTVPVQGNEGGHHLVGEGHHLIGKGHILIGEVHARKGIHLLQDLVPQDMSRMWKMFLLSIEATTTVIQSGLMTML